jgi:hypothetical protein
MKVNYWKAYGLVMTGALAFVVGNSILPADAGAVPHLKAALHNLEQSVNQLNKAKPDKDGHHAKAVTATNTAITEVKAAIDSRKRDDAPAPKK